MSFGIKVINDYSTLQIDDTYKNLTYKFKGTVNTAIVGVVFSIVLDLAYSPVIALRPKGGTGCFVCQNAIKVTSLGGGVNRYTVWVIAAKQSSPVKDFDIDYYVFGPPPSESEVALPQYGMVIRNSSGEITYRSDQKYMSIVGLTSLDSPPNNTSSEVISTRTFPSGRDYAIITSRVSFAKTVINAYPIFVNTYEFVGGFDIKDNAYQIGSKWRLINTVTNNTGYISSTLNGVIIDVTGLG